jgi:predicted metal-binding membrane protein
MNVLAGDRKTAAAGVALGAASAVAWVVLTGYEPPMGLAGFLAGWTLMMAAMMLPSIGPLVLLYRGPRAPLAAGYLLLWGSVGLLPFAAMEREIQPALPIAGQSGSPCFAQ